MAISALKTWTSEILTSADLNAEFAHIRNNALSLISPWTGNMDGGGFRLTDISAGSAVDPAIQVREATTGLYSSATNNLSYAINGINAWSVTLTPALVMTATSTDAAAFGPIFQLFHNSATPAASDFPGTYRFVGNDDGLTARIMGQIACIVDDVTSTSMDSRLLFYTQNAANAVDANTIASLSSAGVWTDASAAAQKDYVGDIDDALGKLRKLTTLGTYVVKGKSADSVKHYSPTAEEFYEVTGLGEDPTLRAPGIAPKDSAWLIGKAVLELEDKLVEISGRVRIAA